jgi:hypothetical protein
MLLLVESGLVDEHVVVVLVEDHKVVAENHEVVADWQEAGEVVLGTLEIFTPESLKPMKLLVETGLVDDHGVVLWM